MKFVHFWKCICSQTRSLTDVVHYISKQRGSKLFSQCWKVKYEPTVSVSVNKPLILVYTYSKCLRFYEQHLWSFRCYVLHRAAMNPFLNGTKKSYSPWRCPFGSHIARSLSSSGTSSLATFWNFCFSLSGIQYLHRATTPQFREKRRILHEFSDNGHNDKAEVELLSNFKK